MKNGALSGNAASGLRAEGLCRSFGFRRVIQEVCLEVKQGEVLAICGPNGSGKSTLVRLLTGLLMPSRGRTWVEMDGKQLSAEERWQLVSLAAPAINPYSHLSLAENISFVGKSRGGISSTGEISALTELIGLADRQDDLVGSFSSGMVQRVRLALAVAARPRVLFLDEPTHCLDDAGRQLVAKLVERQREVGICVIATNDAHDVSLADRTFDVSGRTAC